MSNKSLFNFIKSNTCFL